MAPYTGNSVTTRLNIAFIFSIVEVHEHAVNYTQTKNRFAKKKLSRPRREFPIYILNVIRSFKLSRKQPVVFAAVEALIKCYQECIITAYMANSGYTTNTVKY